MGSQHSSSSSLNKNSPSKKTKRKNVEKDLDFISSNYLNDKSSYKGVKTDTTSLNDNSEKNENNDENISNEIKIPTLFQWKEGGNNIVITGSFCGWSRQFSMLKNKNNNFYEVLLYLPKGEYQFKFIVDNVWKCSNYYKTVTDTNGNTNNYLDNTIEFSKKILEKQNKKIINEKKGNFDFNNNSNNINLEEQMKKYYGIYYPERDFLNVEPPKLPQSYVSPINLCNFGNIGEKKFVYDKMKNNLMKVCYKEIKSPSHIYLNHIFSNCKESDNYIKSNITIRVRSKFTSIIYYNPKDHFH